MFTIQSVLSWQGLVLLGMAIIAAWCQVQQALLFEHVAAVQLMKRSKMNGNARTTPLDFEPDMLEVYTDALHRATYQKHRRAGPPLW